MTLTSLTTTSSTRLASQAPARAASAETPATGVGATLSAMATAASDGVSATISLSDSALKALAQVGESAVEGVIDGSTSVSSAARTVLSSAEDLAVGVWKSARDAVTSVGDLAESGWSDLKSTIASIEDTGGSVIDKIEDGFDDVVSASKATASAASHYAGVALDATTDVVSGITLGSVSLLAVL